MESLHNYFEKIFAEDKPVKLIFSGKRRCFKGNAAACDAVGQSLLSGGVQFR